MFKRYLLAPGPTPVPPEVLLRMALPIIHHRAPDFLPIFNSARKGLKWLFQTENDVLILTSSGTGAMVGSVNNFFNAGEKVLVINGGKFGERWVKICQAYGLQVKEISVEWGNPVDPAQVEKELKGDPSIKGVFVQAVETSTGVYHPIEELGKIASKYDILFVVDSISALVAHDLKTDKFGVDLMVGGSQKGLMLPPGLAFLAVSDKAWKKAQTVKQPGFYFNLKKERESQAKNQTNFTPAISLIAGLDEALSLLQKEGLENVFARHRRLANATRTAVKELGLDIFPKSSPADSVTAINAPSGVDGQEIYKTLREKFGITAAGGQDKLKGKIFRIAHLGYADTFDVITAVSGIEMTFKLLGHPVKLGVGVAAAEKVLVEGIK
jgi:aspartate aminotransferase-like enzyme